MVSTSQHQFEPTQHHEKSTIHYSFSCKESEASKHSKGNEKCLIRTASNLFSRVPVLSSLCTEVLVSQCVSSMINFLFVLKVQEYIPNDEERARWTGNVSFSFRPRSFVGSDANGITDSCFCLPCGLLNYRTVLRLDQWSQRFTSILCSTIDNQSG